MKTTDISTISQRFFILNLFVKDTNKLTLSILFNVFGYFSLFPSFSFLSCTIEYTIYLPGNGRGFFQHYGYWALFATAPILILLTLFLIDKLIFLTSNISKFITEAEVPPPLKNKIEKSLNSLALRTKTKYIFYLFQIIGLLGSIANIVNTIKPKGIYGNDVYDSFSYFWGFLSGKFFLSFIWIFVYPTVFFIIYHVSWTMLDILRHLYQKQILFIDFFNKDNCGGVSIFGLINFIIVSIYMNIIIVLFALSITHANNYPTLVLSIGFVSILSISHSFYGVYYVQKIVKDKKNEYLDSINLELNKRVKNLKSFSQDLIFLRNHILSVKTYPYTRFISFFINTFRISSGIITLIKIWSPV